jgi:hypothetical protein
MGFWKSILTALWLDFVAVEEALLETRSVRVIVRPFVSGLLSAVTHVVSSERPFVSGLLSAMSHVVRKSPLDRIRRLFARVQDGENPRKLFPIPIFQVRASQRFRPPPPDMI